MAGKTTQLVSHSWQEDLFGEKVLFCTGGTGGICGAQVRAMVRLGANACIVGRNVEKANMAALSIQAARPGSKILGLAPVDVRKLEDVERAVKQCVDEFGGIDYVICGAAGNFLAPFQNLSTNAFKTVLEIDLIGSWHTAKATTPHLLNSASKSRLGGYGTGGRIIFISATGHHSGIQLNTHAVVAKAGVDVLAAQLAIELGPFGITSNVIAPGPIRGTEGVKRLIRTEGEAGRLPSIPLGRLGSLKEISDAVIYLFADTGDYVNGHVLVVDGGAWRTGGGQIADGIPYPEFLLSGKDVQTWFENKAGSKL